MHDCNHQNYNQLNYDQYVYDTYKNDNWYYYNYNYIILKNTLIFLYIIIFMVRFNYKSKRLKIIANKYINSNLYHKSQN